MAKWRLRASQGEFLYTALTRSASDAQVRRLILASDGLRSGSIADADDRAQFAD